MERQGEYKIGLCIEERNGPFETRKDKENGSEVMARHIITYDKMEEVYTIYGLKPKTRKWKKQEKYYFQYYDLEKLIDFINLVIGNEEENLTFVFFHYEEDSMHNLDSVVFELKNGIMPHYILSAYDDEKMSQNKLREYIDLLTGYVQ